jgi:perosamine synthetase
MTNMQAAIGLAQLEQIEKTVLRKREIGTYYQEALSGIESIQLPVPQTEYAENIYWVFGIVLRDPKQLADELMRKLGEKGIGTRHFFYPLHKQPALIKEECCKDEYLDDKQFGNANFISEHGFYIPSGLGLTFEEQRYVVEEIKKIL